MFIKLQNFQKVFYLCVQNTSTGPGAMAQLTDIALACAGISYRRQFVSLLLQFPSISLLVAWESNRGCFKFVNPCIHVGDTEQASNSWLLIGSTLAVAALLGNELWMEDIFPSRSANLL